MHTLESRFIETPTRPMLDYKTDFTAIETDLPWDIAFGVSEQIHPPSGSRLRLTVKVFADEYEKLNIAELETYCKSMDVELTLQVIRMPRANVRAATILEQENLYDKLLVNSEIINEKIPEGVKLKAEKLETMNSEKIFEEVRDLA